MDNDSFDFKLGRHDHNCKKAKDIGRRYSYTKIAVVQQGIYGTWKGMTKCSQKLKLIDKFVFVQAVSKSLYMSYLQKVIIYLIHIND